MGKTVQSEESFRSSILEIRLELGIVVGVAVVEKNDEKVGPRQTWKKRKYSRCADTSLCYFVSKMF